MPTTASLPAPSKPKDRISVARLIAGYGAIACALPYRPQSALARRKPHRRRRPLR